MPAPADLGPVLVTGGSRGLGLGLAHALAEAGYAVVAIARQPTDALAKAQQAIAGEGRGALHFRGADLADIEALPELVASLRQEFGTPYGLVNNAGLGTEGLLAMMHNSQIEDLVRLNTVSPIILTKYVVRLMMAERRGRIVNVSSIIGTTGYSGLSVYGATKAALLGFTRSLAREVGRLDVTVNAVAPGFLDTAMTAGMGADQRETVARRSALRRIPEVKDVAGAVLFLMGESGRNVTGTVLTVDAGNTA